LTAFLETDPTREARERMRRRARQTLEALIDQPVETAAVTQFIGKIESGLDYWLPFVTNLEVAPTNNAGENALREPVVLRKIMGTLRTESGRFTHETLLSLVATWKQQDRHPYDELKRMASPRSTSFWVPVSLAGNLRRR
jgi:phage baseplate assembly protein W